ncbi:type II toxin-antitoxin system YafQ family toxin [Lacticaseibacillus parakribbianus]|uniref:type II toxin-antitoxin system YafQ family toxin n=1 Tax=Lacticaseibacillus parakribbianus TaxID=2970927 RepID=UPI0021CB31A4|nr:type II toxin-antitoxin system YafQ family toxin [Lacticaseibacillus parakribbianus]
MGNELFPTRSFRKNFRRVKQDPRWRAIFSKPSRYEGTTLPPWEFIRNCLLNNVPIPSYFYPHPITPPKRLVQQIKAAVGHSGEVRVIDLHFDGHNGDHLLVYCDVPDRHAVVLINIGTHADLFR